MTVREQQRLIVITEFLAERWTATEAALKLELSLRQMRRLLAAYRRDDPAGLVHANRGRPSPRRIPPYIREEVLSLARTSYPDYNDHHLTETLAEDHVISLSRASGSGGLALSLVSDHPGRSPAPSLGLPIHGVIHAFDDEPVAVHMRRLNADAQVQRIEPGADPRHVHPDACLLVVAYVTMTFLAISLRVIQCPAGGSNRTARTSARISVSGTGIPRVTSLLA